MILTWVSTAKLIAHKPSIISGSSAVSDTVPTNFPDTALNAWIVPSPKLPINKRWANGPKSDGARATPHGAFIHAPCCKRSNQLSIRIKDRHVAQAGAVIFIFFTRRAACERHHQVSTDVLDIERDEIARQVWILKFISR